MELNNTTPSSSVQQTNTGNCVAQNNSGLSISKLFGQVLVIVAEAAGLWICSKALIFLNTNKNHE